MNILPILYSFSINKDLIHFSSKDNIFTNYNCFQSNYTVYFILDMKKRVLKLSVRRDKKEEVLKEIWINSSSKFHDKKFNHLVNRIYKDFSKFKGDIDKNYLDKLNFKYYNVIANIIE